MVEGVRHWIVTLSAPAWECGSLHSWRLEYVAVGEILRLESALMHLKEKTVDEECLVLESAAQKKKKKKTVATMCLRH